MTIPDLTLKTLFDKNIFRPINGVVKAEQKDHDALRQELEEYVLTEELDRHFRSFYRYFNQSLDQHVDKHGIWISGFFGSGKSHFLKMLGYLLGNQPEVDQRKPLDFFDESKVKDALFRQEIKRPTQFPMDIILFNIDSKARSQSGQKDTIVNVFWRVFDDMQGYFGEVPHIAEMEAHLDREGLWESFQQSFERINGESWVNKRRGHAFLKTQIVQALQEVTGLPAEAAGQILNDVKASLSRSPESFAKRVKEYLDSKGKNHRVLFLVDEVGQYIGDSSDLMLNLQTVVEDFSIHCDGRAWVLVTSQEDIDSILKNLNQVRRNDFSKIQGRFYPPLSLSSANTDEVIKKRLLSKTPAAQDALKAFYAHEKVNLKNLIVFAQDAAYYPYFKDEQDFVDTYPFLPYQFTLLQQVFRSIREAGGSGKHMAEGERSMLESFKLTLESLAEKPLGTLVPFYYFYQAIEGFLDHSIRWVFQQAEKNEALEHPFDLQLLKILFMIRWVKELKPNQDNLLTLMVSDTNTDKAQLRQEVLQALARLERQTLVQRNGDAYYFLTNEEQEIMRKIKGIGIDPSEVNQKLQVLIFGQIYPGNKLRYDANHIYECNKRLDEVFAGPQKGTLNLHLITPCGDYASYNDMTCCNQTLSGETALVRLPEDPKLYLEVQHLLQTEKYFQLHGTGGGSTVTQKIHDQFSREKSNRESELQNHLARLITEADVFTGGEKVGSIERKSAKDLMDSALRRLVNHVFPKLDDIQSHYNSEKEVDAALTTPLNQTENYLEGTVANAKARSSMMNWFTDQELRQSVVTVARMLEHFAQKPFGWAELDSLGIMGELIYTRKLELRLHQVRQKPETGLCKRLLTKQGSNEFVVVLQREIAPADLRLAQTLLKEQFDQTSPPQDAEALFKLFQHLVSEQLTQLKAYQDVSQAIYPCHELLVQTYKVLSRLLEAKDTPHFFEGLRTLAPELEEHHNHFSDLESFYSGQKATFDKALELLQALKSEIIHLQDVVLRENYAKAETIMGLKDDRIFRQLPQVSLLLQPVEQGVKQALLAQQKQVVEMIEAAQTRIHKAYPDLTQTPEFSKWLAPLGHLRQAVAHAERIDTILARSSQITRLEEQILTEIAEWLSKKVPPDEPEPDLPKTKPVTSIKPAQCAKKDMLETERDVEEFIDHLKGVLMKEIHAEKRIQLK